MRGAERGPRESLIGGSKTARGFRGCDGGEGECDVRGEAGGSDSRHACGGEAGVDGEADEPVAGHKEVIETGATIACF